MAKDRRGSRRRVLVCEQHFEDIKFPSSGASICGLRCFEASTTIKVQIMKWFFHHQNCSKSNFKSKK